MPELWMKLKDQRTGMELHVGVPDEYAAEMRGFEPLIRTGFAMKLARLFRQSFEGFKVFFESRSCELGSVFEGAVLEDIVTMHGPSDWLPKPESSEDSLKTGVNLV